MSKETCPVSHNTTEGCPVSKKSSSDSCPVSHKTAEGCPVSKKSTESCPVSHGTTVNPANWMPNLPQTMAEGQQTPLSTDRKVSSIPRGAQEKWEYPSSQQFYNALKRKGYETEEKDIDTLVAIHNFINEGAWDALLRWEDAFHCDCKDISLKKFQGRPHDLTPKARFFSMLQLSEKPFDRHDWTVDRCGEEVRYVLDFYTAPSESPDQPVFHVDVRPALDSFSAAWDRTRMFFKDCMDPWS